MADNRKFASVLAKRLKTDISASDTTFKLPDITWYTGSDGVAVTLASSDFGTVAYGVFEPNTARQEFFTWDPTTIANYATTGISILARGLPWSADYTTESSTRKWGHDGGSKVLLMTNAPAFYDQFTNKNNDETIAGDWTFSVRSPSVPTELSSETGRAASIAYVNAIAVAGAPDGSTTVKGLFEEATVAEQGSATATGATGARLILANANLVKTSSGAGDENKIAVLDASGTFANGFIDKIRTWLTTQSFTADLLQITTDADSANDPVRYSQVNTLLSTNIPLGAISGTSGEAITAGDGVYKKASDGKYYKTDTDLSDAAAFTFAGIALTTVAGADLSFTFAPPGHTVTGLTGLTDSSYYFLTDTAGALSTTPGTRFARVALALSTTTLLVLQPKYMASGSFTYIYTDASPLPTQTCGFYPAKIEFRAIIAANSAIISVGDQGGSVAIGVMNSGTSSSNAWYLDKTGTGNSTGNVGVRTATGFSPTHTTTANLGTMSVRWTAESL